MYYCDLALRSFSKTDVRRLPIKVSFIVIFSFLFITPINALILYNIHGGYLDTYSESAYKYLDEIADNVIEKEGINVAAIPDDIVKYEITYKDDRIIFKYSLDNNKGKEFATSASMTLILSKDFEILSREPNFSSKEEYEKIHKGNFYASIYQYSLIIWVIMFLIIFFIMVFAIAIYMEYKEKTLKNPSELV